MVKFEELIERKEKICVVGLGYVGLPLAILLSKKYDVFGFDINNKRIEELKDNNDTSNELSDNELKESNIVYTNDENDISKCKFIIIAVPTPVDKNKVPDLSIVENVSALVGRNMSSGSLVVYESTVYPGATEEKCLPILESESKLISGQDFWIGYSPERVNPGDKKHTIDKVVKIVSAMDNESLELISKVYGEITTIFKATSIRVAEAAKVVENTQRNINIALMNELAVMFKNMDICIYDVLEAAGTKWNFLKFKPGLVGGHCIGVDPYYLTYKSQEYGYNPEMILAGRDLNDRMYKFIVQEIIKETIKQKKDLSKSNIVIMGATFKENVTDVRNSKVFDIYYELEKFGIKASIYDPHALNEDVFNEYKVNLINEKELINIDVMVMAVAHDVFKEIGENSLSDMINEGGIVFDIKNILKRDIIEDNNIKYWSF